MAARRTLSLLAALAVGPALAVVVAASPAGAHGATTDPLSRVAACGPDGGFAQSAACQAALAISSADAFTAWDNLRVADVAGRDREVIPDGQLCSGGLPAYQGLDLPRADWPATRLTAGSQFTFRYRSTIPHEGTFRVYVTKDSYRPTDALNWADLEDEPFLTVTDPPLRSGSYVMTGRLPAGKSGRHLIYVIWQNSSTTDTYYSCSDVVFASAAVGIEASSSGSSPGSASGSAAGSASRSGAGGAAGTSGSAGSGRAGQGSTSASDDDTGAYDETGVSAATGGSDAADADAVDPTPAVGSLAGARPVAVTQRSPAALPLIFGGAAVLIALGVLGLIRLRRRPPES